MKTVYMLIGITGSGKTTWISNQDWLKNIPIISSDNLIEEYAKSINKTYNDVFLNYVEIAQKEMYNQIENLIQSKKSFVWDQTNLSEKSREYKLKKIKDYKKIAVVFPIPNAIELKRRLEQRPDKVITENVMLSMIKDFSIPTEKEGFSEIWYAGI